MSIIKGFVKDSDNNSIENVSIKYGNEGTITNASGFYHIRIPLNTKVTLQFSHVGYKSLTKDFITKKRNIIRFSPVLILKSEVLEEVEEVGQEFIDKAQYSAHWPGTILLFAIAIRQRRTT